MVSVAKSIVSDVVGSANSHVVCHHDDLRPSGGKRKVCDSVMFLTKRSQVYVVYFKVYVLPGYWVTRSATSGRAARAATAKQKQSKNIQTQVLRIGLD